MEDDSGSRLAVVLSEFIDPDGKVDYSALDRGGEVARFVEGLEGAKIGNLVSANERLAFWINAYNMLTIHGVMKELKRNPRFAQTGNKSYLKRVNFFYRTKYVVAGRSLSLYEIENKILRKEFSEPRIHFALNCGSSSCPLLKDGMYSSENLDQELEAAATLFIRSPSGANLDTEKGVLYLSSIFKWYKKDFEATSGSLLDFVKRYMDDGDREYVERMGDKLKVKYQPYDWGLNAA